MVLWKTEMLQREKSEQLKNDFDALCCLAFAQYGYVGYLLSSNKWDEADKWLIKLDKNVQILREKQPENSTLYALHGAYYGMKISIQKWKAPVYGPRSMDLINTAVLMDSTNAYAWNEKANMTYHMPSFIGGGRANGIAALEKAVLLMDSHVMQYKFSWMYLLSNTTLARWYFEDEQYDKAKKQYNKLLRVAPNYKWTTGEMLTKLKL